MRLSEPAPAKLNLALHVRGKLPDGRHAIETIFAFCTDGDRVEAEASDGLSLETGGPFGHELSTDQDNLVLRAAEALRIASGSSSGARLKLTKSLPVASGIGGGSADAAATLRLLTRLWSVDPVHATAVASGLGSDVPACLLSMTARGEGAGDILKLVDAGVSDAPVLLVNPNLHLSTGAIFAKWDGVDRGPLSDWRDGRNDLQPAALEIAPAIGDMLDWLAAQRGSAFARMSGSGATCFALFDSEGHRDAAAADCPSNWWNIPTVLR